MMSHDDRVDLRVRLHVAGDGLKEGIFVTPMLVMIAPPPELRVLGSLRDRQTPAAARGLKDAS